MGVRKHTELTFTVLLLVTLAAGAHAQGAQPAATGPFARLREGFSSWIQDATNALQSATSNSRNNRSQSPSRSQSTPPGMETTPAFDQSTLGEEYYQPAGARPSRTLRDPPRSIAAAPRRATLLPKVSFVPVNTTRGPAAAPAPAPATPAAATTPAVPAPKTLQDMDDGDDADNRGKSCSGQITAVWCREDASGALQDITFMNSVSGLQTAGCSGSSSDSYSKALILDKGEAITSVQACNTKKHGYTSLTFITDGNKQFTCGNKNARRIGDGNGQQLQDALARNLNNTMIRRNATSGDNIRLQFVDDLEDEVDDEPLAVDSDDRSTRAAARRDRRARRAARRQHASRSLLVDEPLSVNASAAKPSTWWWFDWGHGNDNQQPDQSCQSYTPQHAPIWASARGPEAIKVVGSGEESYLEFGNTRFYKSPELYSQAQEAQRANPLAFTPAFFWTEVHPLAGLNLECKDGLATRMKDVCWDTNFRPPTAPWGVRAQISLTMEADAFSGAAEDQMQTEAEAAALSCPKTPRQIQSLMNGLQRLSTQISGASGGVVGSIAWDKYTPAACTQGTVDRNTTITLRSTLVPSPGSGLLATGNWLLFRAGPDMCDLTFNGQSACEGTGVYATTQSLLIFGALGNQEEALKELEKQQQQRVPSVGGAAPAKQPPT